MSPIVCASRLAGLWGFWFLLALPSACWGQVQVEAIQGEPFGVGMVRLALPARGAEPLLDDRVTLREKSGRALYPAYEDAPLRRALRGLLNLEGPRQIAAYFLFRGEGPLDLTLYTPEPRDIRVLPVPADPRRRGRLLDAWWRNYTANAQQLDERVKYPRVLHNYLIPTLARRLDLPLPPDYRPGNDLSGELDETIKLFLATEGPRSDLQRQVLLLAQHAPEAALLPLPAHAASGWEQRVNRPASLPGENLPAERPGVAPPIPEGERLEELPPPQPTPARPVPARLDTPPAPRELLELETIAQHVPVECFYVRFGSFGNYLWLRDLLDRWGGDARNMVTAQGLDYRMSERLERQLALRSSAMARLVGPAVIADVAIIGHDPFVREGAGMGILFHARQSGLLARDIKKQRSDALQREPAAREETVRIAGREVSFIQTADQRLRSFYVADGDFHLVTTSRHLVERFLEAGAGEGSLAQDGSFVATRARLRDGFTVFAYFSEAFFRELASPHYRIETTRRLKSVAEMEMLRLARLAARGEGIEAATVEELIAAGLLPPHFGKRMDGSRLEFQGEELLDSQRGAAGSFIPIADMQIKGATAAEVEAYQRFAEQYGEGWMGMGPMVAGITRRPLAGQTEQLRVAFRIENLNPRTYTKGVENFGEARREWVPPLPGDLVWGQLTSSGRRLLAFAPAPPTSEHLLFGALRDFGLPAVGGGDVLFTLAGLGSLRGYVGAWPHPGLLERLWGGGPVPFDPQGYAPLTGLLGGWVRQVGEFTLFSAARELLEEIGPRLRVVEAPEPANLRLRVTDLTGTELADVANRLAFYRARKASLGGAKFINRLSEQFHVPPPAAATTAESLLDAQIVCPLQGKYVLVEQPGGLAIWSSDRVDPRRRPSLSDDPGEYRIALLEWFRGARLNAGLIEGGLSGEFEILQKVEGAGQFPFSVPGLFR